MPRFSRLLLALLLPAAGRAQTMRQLSLNEALRLAEGQSEAVHIAQAGVLRAHGQQLQAFSQYLPQLNGTASYTRTLASQFSALRSAVVVPPAGTPPVPPADPTRFYAPCTRYLATAGATEAERVAGLENFAKCSANSSGGIDFSKVGFGAENQYNLGLAGSFTLFSGGRVQAQNSAANSARRSADIELAAQHAKLTLDVTQAYFDAALADRLVAIAESSLAQTESVLQQTRLAREVGNQSEFELLRAQVARDNQVPVLLQRRTDRQLAYLRLKQQLNLPASQAVSLTTSLGDEEMLPPSSTPVAATPSAAAMSAPLNPAAIAPAVNATDTSVTNRAAVREIEAALAAQEAQQRITRSERFPTLTLSSSYGRLAFPQGATPQWSNFLTNWTVTVGASMPLFTGGRLRGDALIAEAGVREMRERLQQTRELAALDAEQTVAQLAQAEAALRASMGTAEQASRAYTIAEVRFREGLSTQVELSDARLLLQQASANRAQAMRNVQVARTKLAVLKDLPLGAGTIVTSAPAPAQPPQ